MWNHVKTVQTDEEGMEVAGLLGDSKALLLRGHGATTVGASLQEAVMHMVPPEAPGKLNYWAYSATRPAHS